MHRRIVAALVFLVAVTLSHPPTSQAQLEPRCFTVPGIINCIEARFRQYWEHHGELPVFGYPITAQANEFNRDTNQTYLTQWFERNRFELHGENQAPYDVLLGRLGVDRLIQQGRDWTTFPKAAANAPHFFAATGHAIAHGPFWQYWSTHGLEFDGRSGKSEPESLALFGMPVSEPMTETNAAGDTVLTQWFERARFEDHGAKGVLLGLLGNEIRAGSAAPPPAPPTLPPPSLNGCQDDPNAGRAPNFPVQIVAINKVEEIVSLKNVSTQTVDLTGWTLCSIRGNQIHQSIGGSLEPNQTKHYPNTGGANIWSNEDRDNGALYNPSGQLVSYWNDGGSSPPPAPAPTPGPTPRPTSPPTANCHASYPDFCIPPPPPDLDCDDIPRKNFRVLPPDPHRLDSDGDGIGCES